MSTAFSNMLLAFISTERLAAVRRPLAFSSSSERAKKAVIRLAMFGGLVTTLFDVALPTCCPLLGRIIVMSLLGVSVSVMIICYFLVTVTLLKNRTFRTSAGVEVGVSFPMAGTSVVKEIRHVDNISRTIHMTPVPPNPQSKTTSDKPAQPNKMCICYLQFFSLSLGFGLRYY